jgi:hypothetical protein
VTFFFVVRIIQPFFVSVSDIIPTITVYEYEGYLIAGWARPEVVTNGFTSVGIVYKRELNGGIIQVQRIEGELFDTKQQAEQHGVALCKEWIDKQITFAARETVKVKQPA